MLKVNIEYLYNLCIKYNSKIATTLSKDVYSYDIKVKNKKEKVLSLSNLEYLKDILLDNGRTGTIWNKLIDKKLFNNIRFEDRIVNDVVVTYKLLLEVDNIVYSNQIKYYYFRHKSSITKKCNTDREKDLYNAAIERYNYLRNIYPKLLENRICVLYIIALIYSHKNEEVNEFLKEKDAFKLYKKLYTNRLLFTKMKFREKIKLILFRINPRLNNFIIKVYLKIRGKYESTTDS